MLCGLHQYAFFNKIHYFQITAINLDTRMTFRYLHDEKTTDNIINFINRMLDYFPFRVHCFSRTTVQNLLIANIHLKQNTH